MKILTISYEKGKYYEYGRREIDSQLKENNDIKHIIIKEQKSFLKFINLFNISLKIKNLIVRGKFVKFLYFNYDCLLNKNLFLNFNQNLWQKIDKDFSKYNFNLKESKEEFTNDINSYLSKINNNCFDILIVLGAPYLDKNNINKFNQKINLHLGYLPDFKGCRTIEAAILEKRFDKVGFTIHNLNSKLDGGSIIYSEKVDCLNQKSISSIYSLCLLKGFKKLIEIIPEIDTIKSTSNSKGKFYDFYFFNSKKYRQLLEMGYYP